MDRNLPTGWPHFGTQKYSHMLVEKSFQRCDLVTEHREAQARAVLSVPFTATDNSWQPASHRDTLPCTAPTTLSNTQVRPQSCRRSRSLT